jgi:fatty-acyl-CoA synthase
MKDISQQDVEKELTAIMRQFLIDSGETHQGEIKLRASLQRHLGIDSLSRAELFRKIEKAFEVRFPDKLLVEADSLNDIANFLLQANPAIIKPQQPTIITSHGKSANLDPGNAATLIDVLLLYAEKSPEKPHIYFQDEHGQEQIISYGDLLKSSLRVAAGLRELGLQNGETVAIMQPSHPHFFYTFFGTLFAGGIPVPIYPPFRMHMLEAYAKTEAQILRNAEVRILVSFDEAEKFSLLLKSFVPSLKHVVTVDGLLEHQELAASFHAHSHSHAFIQYTSGSTSDPKGVLLTHHNLLSNIHVYGKAIQVKPDDVAVSWLPLYHDMGLIGMWLGSLYYGIPLVLMTPFSFLTHPERWLWAIHYHRGTVSGAPNFAYELCINKISPELLEGLDLSSWRVAANGAEKIYPSTLERFANKFACYGFKRNALFPVYGLAESTLAVTLPPLGRDFLIDKIDRKQFEEEKKALPSKQENALEFVSCGSPIEGHAVRIVDEENKVLAEREVGRLQFCGPSNMQSYFNNPKATQAAYHDGWLDSGDLAYQANGEFFITGRRKDLIIKAGRNVYPAELEALSETIVGVRKGCVIAFAVSDQEQGTEKIIIAAETKEKNKLQGEKIIAAIKEIISTTLEIVPDHVVLIAPHTIPKTSSGKLQRAACKAMYLEGRLGKRQRPVWLQMLSLGAKAVLRKIKSALFVCVKFIYTVYVAFLAGLTFFPMYFLVINSTRDKASKAVKIWARWMLRFMFCPVDIANAEKLLQASPCIFTPNHASYFDAIVVVAIVPSTTRMVIKKEAFSIPLIKNALRKMDYLAVDRLDLSQGLEDTKRIEQVLKAGHPVLIFPEGTFGYAAGLRPFRLGAFKIAVETQIPVCPIAMQGTRYILRDDEKLMCPRRISITVCDLIFPSGKEWQDVTKLRNTVRAEIAKHCGEPSLDFIAAQIVAPKQEKSE